MSFAQDLQNVTADVTSGMNAEQKALFASFLEDLKESGPGLQPLGVGDEMPPFVLPNATGGTVSSSELLVRGPLVVVFYRGSWCPWCNIQLRAIQEAIDEIHELGAELVAISPMTPDNSLSMVEKKGLSYHVLSDSTLKVSSSFGLVYALNEQMQAFHEAIGVDLKAFNAQARGLVIPATYIVDDGVVVSRVDPDWRERMDPLEVIAALNKLGK